MNCPKCGFSSLPVPGLPASSPQGGESPLTTSSFPDCTIAKVLTGIAVLDFIGAVIAGWVVGNDSLNSGLIVFFSGIFGGIFILGFAFVLRYLHAIAHRLEIIEKK